LKKLSAVFWKRNLAFAKLAIVTNLEYRLNYIVDAIVQPILTTGIEILLWIGVFAGAQTTAINGLGREFYLSYALWAAFFARISTSWMYEFRMVEEIGSGTLNSLIVRPMGFYEYYLSQLLGYKFITTLVSLGVPILAAYLFHFPTVYSRIPLATLLCFYYLILVHTISFLVCCAAFHFTKISSFTVAKNLLLWIVTGELFPLDLIPAPWKGWMIASPFASGVYIPVGYITGRVGINEIQNAFISVTIAIIVFNFVGTVFWKKGLESYAGTGA
jgi:ABC-2 type transport system permease protein